MDSPAIKSYHVKGVLQCHLGVYNKGQSYQSATTSMLMSDDYIYAVCLVPCFMCILNNVVNVLLVSVHVHEI